MPRIILIRHGETDWNREQRYQGQTDIPLNERGRSQARNIAAYLRQHEAVEAVYSSDLVRCRETASIIAGVFNLPVNSDARLRELRFGYWEGLRYEELDHTFHEEFQQWFRNTRDYAVPGGESFAQALDRMLPCIAEIAGRHRGTAAICSHGGIIRAFINHLDPSFGFWDRSLHPGSLSIINCEADVCRVEAAEFLTE